MFKLGNNTNIFLEKGAVAIGSFDVHCNGSKVYGPGVLHGGYADAFEVWDINNDAIEASYAMFYSTEGAGIEYSNTIQDIICLSQPHRTTHGGIKVMRNVGVVAPWNWVSNAFNTFPWWTYASNPLSGISEVRDCYGFVGDDTLKLVVKRRNVEVSGVFCITSNNSCLFGNTEPYNPVIEGRGIPYAKVTDCDLMHIGLTDNYDPGPGIPYQADATKTLIQFLTDGPESEATWGHFHHTFENIRVWGPVRGRLLQFGNYLNQFAPTEGMHGQLSGFEVTDLWVEEQPDKISTITGLDAISTAHDIIFRNLNINGVSVVNSNYGDFIQVDEVVYNLDFSEG